jgi:hypothetical protein
MRLSVSKRSLKIQPLRLFKGPLRDVWLWSAPPERVANKWSVCPTWLLTPNPPYVWIKLLVMVLIIYDGPGTALYAVGCFCYLHSHRMGEFWLSSISNRFVLWAQSLRLALDAFFGWVSIPNVRLGREWTVQERKSKG